MNGPEDGGNSYIFLSATSNLFQAAPPFNPAESVSSVSIRLDTEYIPLGQIPQTWAGGPGPAFKAGTIRHFASYLLTDPFLITQDPYQPTGSNGEHCQTWMMIAALDKPLRTT